MTAPNMWVHLYWKLFDKKTLEENRPKYYHAGIIKNENTIIEQQWKVQEKVKKTMSWGSNYIIIRKSDLTYNQRDAIVNCSLKDLGESYGVLECIGNFTTWLTGIKCFRRVLATNNHSQCIVKVCEW